MNFKKSQKLGNYTGQYSGVTMDEMLDLERCFNVKILIYSLSPDGVVCNVYKSVNYYDSKMYLNVYENHLSYIVDINKIAKNFQCEKCLKLFTREWNRVSENKIRPEVSERYIDSYVWLDDLSCKEGIKIRHKINNQKEVRRGNFRVDGFCYQNKTVYEFNGCYYHGCKFNCFIVKT